MGKGMFLRISGTAAFGILLFLLLSSGTAGNVPQNILFSLIAVLLIVSACLLILAVVLRSRVKKKERREEDQAREIVDLKDTARARALEIDRLNEELGGKIKEIEDLSKKMKEHRDDLGNLVRERTVELEKLTEEMSESQKALIYLVEDVNESRTELESLNAKLNTALKDAETARDNIDAILFSIADGLIVADVDSRIVLINHVAEKIFNVRSEEVVGKKTEEIVPFDRAARERLDKKDRDIDIGFDVKKKERIYNARVSIVWGNSGFATGSVILLRDVTLEREINEAKTDFISTSAHELRTPLTSIRGFTEILLTRKDLGQEEREKFLNYISRQAMALGNIINNLLDISRIESGKGYELVIAEFKPHELLRKVVEPFMETTGGFNFRVMSDEPDRVVFADESLLNQVLTNLVSNAVKYSPGGGDIILRSIFKDGQLILEVEDHGVGMTPVQTERVFEKFYRADSRNTAVEGTGLGMSIVKNIVDAHQGKINVVSRLNSGTRVTITIPDIRPEAENGAGSFNQREGVKK